MGTVFVRLEDTAATPGFTPRWFIAESGQENKFLAVALTAQANNQTILVYTDPTLEQGYRVVVTFYAITE
ncbi:MAG: hypothetical protein JXB49_15970 [Bacteroidales bacterium]|nr:hypothetical protein [Bacteroidales bacterium]